MDPTTGPPRPCTPPVDQPCPDTEETARLAALHGLGLLDTGCEVRFDRIVALARMVFETPAAAITLIDADRQWVKAAAGVESGVSVPRDYSPCHYTVQHPGPLIIADTKAEPRVSNMTVVHQGIRFYAGQPLKAPTGERIGSLCITDTTPRRFTAEQQEVLAQMGQVVEWELAATDELATAAAAQRALIPADTIQVPGYELAGRCTPARRADGSYFDWHLVDGRLQLQVADVIGAGVSSAVVIAACVRILLRSLGQDRNHRRATDWAATGIRTLLGEAETFVTAFAATLDPATGSLTYVAAGHGAAVILGSDGDYRRLASSGPALGLSTAYGTGWEVSITSVAPGETLLVLSDGFLDLPPDPDNLLGRALDRVAERYPEGIGPHQAVELATAWVVTRDHPTDITVLALHRTRT